MYRSILKSVTLMVILSAGLAVAKPKEPGPDDIDVGGNEPVPQSLLDFFAMSDQIFWAERPQEKPGQRPPELGQWQTVIYTNNNLQDYIPGNLIDDQNKAFLNLGLKGPTDNSSVPVHKSFVNRNWFNFYPAGNDYYIIGVSGVDASHHYQPLIGVLAVSPDSPNVLRIELVEPFGVKTPYAISVPGTTFYFKKAPLEVKQYHFRALPVGDDYSFFLQHAKGRYVGSPVDSLPTWVKNGGKWEEIVSWGLFQLKEKVLPAEKSLFQFKLCDHFSPDIRNCVLFK